MAEESTHEGIRARPLEPYRVSTPHENHQTMCYRVIFLDKNGQVSLTASLFAPDDEEAKHKAKSMVDGHGIDLWAGCASSSISRRSIRISSSSRVSRPRDCELISRQSCCTQRPPEQTGDVLRKSCPGAVPQVLERPLRRAH